MNLFLDKKSIIVAQQIKAAIFLLKEQIANTAKIKTHAKHSALIAHIKEHLLQKDIYYFQIHQYRYFPIY